MKELNDIDFDQTFKKRIKDAHLEYEEESWLKMEKKLRRKDRLVLYRNASIILIFLTIGIGIYMMNDKKVPSNNLIVNKKIEKPKHTESLARNINTDFLTLKFKKKNISVANHRISALLSSLTDTTIIIAPNSNVIATPPPHFIPSSSDTEVLKSDISTTAIPNETANNVKKSRLPVTLSINFGPDFTSTESTLGGKGGMAIGLGISIPLNRKLSLQTGLNYSSKNYDAKGYNYTFNNPNVVTSIAGIEASCNVLEIPLRASYVVLDRQKNSLQLNAGLSSYFMLKENYRFIYTPASGRADRFLEEKNANQHYLSVIDLSATYNIKLKNKKFALGIEPYLKIPVSGIGEGNVPLKSSGISLKLNYELNKKN